MIVCPTCGLTKKRSDFGVDNSRTDGLRYWCLSCDEIILGKKCWSEKTAFRRDVVQWKEPPREGDKIQAQRRIAALIRNGEMKPAKEFPCFDCGHVYKPGRQEDKHEYDHYLGYGAEHHEDVQPVCYKCHTRRHAERSGVRSYN